jgi:UDP-2,3-diacylglucosamine hydrolase
VPLRHTLFISDLHLDDSRPAVVEGFERFLATTAKKADALYILGDLFEYWVGDDGLELPLPARTAEALSALAMRVPAYFMHGNRDFLIAERFSSVTGVKLLADPSVVDLYGRDTILMHGDTLCTDDVSYQKFRAQVRNPAWQAAVLAKPLAARIELARQLRETSDTAKGDKVMAIMDVAPAAVEAAFRAHGCDTMIHGHTHRPGRHEHSVDGRTCVRWVLPDWYGAGGYLEASAEGIRARDLA